MRSVWGWTLLVLLSVASVAAGNDELVNATRAQDAAAVRALLEGGADVDTRVPDGATALSWAAHWDDLSIADLLVRAGSDVNASNDLGVGPLVLACENGSTAMVELLLRAKADANIRRMNGQTVLMMCARAGNANAVEALLTHGASVNAVEPQRGQTALMWAADQDHVDVVQALLQAGADIHARSHGGYTSVLFAARVGALDAARLLLAEGANVNDLVTPTAPEPSVSAGPYGDPAVGSGATALLVATVSGHWDLARFLLEEGADPNAGTAGFTALHWAAGEWETDISGPFGAAGYQWIAALRPDKLTFVQTLLRHGADVNARLTKAPPRLAFSLGSALGAAGATPLILAAKAGDVAIMRSLVEAGADPKLTTDDETTALMTAAGIGRVIGESNVTPSAAKEAVQFALELDIDVHAANVAGETALHGAAYDGADEVVQLLVDKGAEVNVHNRSWGYTPLAIAERFSGPSTGANTVSHPSTAALLQELGGDKTVEFEGTIIATFSGCPASMVSVRATLADGSVYRTAHTVTTGAGTTFINGGCADLEEGTTIALKGTRQVDSSILISELVVTKGK